MEKYCEDCGCILEGGVCSNCQEELFIIRNQLEDIDFPLSKDFIDKANRQEKELEDRKTI
jgi:hypothetical protein